MKVTTNTTKDDFIKALYNGDTHFTDSERKKYFSILSIDSELNAVIQTDKNLLYVSGTKHALARLFSLWQIGELY